MNTHVKSKVDLLLPQVKSLLALHSLEARWSSNVFKIYHVSEKRPEFHRYVVVKDCDRMNVATWIAAVRLWESYYA